MDFLFFWGRPGRGLGWSVGFLGGDGFSGILWAWLGWSVGFFGWVPRELVLKKRGGGDEARVLGVWRGSCVEVPKLA